MHDTDVKRVKGIPVSSGMPPIVRLAVFVGVVIIFAIIGVVGGTAMQGHVWPAEDSVKIKLK